MHLLTYLLTCCVRHQNVLQTRDNLWNILSKYNAVRVEVYALSLLHVKRHIRCTKFTREIFLIPVDTIVISIISVCISQLRAHTITTDRALYTRRVIVVMSACCLKQ